MIYPAAHQGHVERFVAQLRDGVPSNGAKSPMQQGMARKFRLQGMQFEMVGVDAALSKAQAYRSA